MPWSQISSSFLQYQATASGTSASGYYLKCYAAGTTTPINVSLDDTGSTLVAKVELDSQGFAQNASGGSTAVYVDQSYRLVLYANATDADANTFANALQDVDNITPLQTVSTLTSINDFDTVSDAIAASLTVGGTVQTKGYNTVGDGGAALYNVVAAGTGTADGGSYINSNPAGSFQLNLINSQIYVEHFGVDGTADAADAAAWQAALDYARENDIELNGTPGKTYLFDPESNGGAVGNGLAVVLQDGESFRFNGNWCEFKFAVMSNQAGAFWHMILVVMRSLYGVTSADADEVVFRNIIVNGNFANQPTPAGGNSDYEQRSALKVQAFATESNTINNVLFQNIKQIDPIADTIVIGPSQGVSVGGFASIRNATVDNFFAGKRDGARAAFIFGSECGKINVSNVSRELPAGAAGNAIETEFSTIGDQYVEINLTNVFMDEIELAGETGQEDQLQVNCENVHATDLWLMVRGNIKATNCTIPVSTASSQRCHFFEATNCTFVHEVYDDGGVQDARSLNLNPETSDSIWREVNCRHVIDGTMDGGANNYLIDGINIDSAEADDHIVELIGVTFDEAAVRCVNLFSGGTLKTRGVTWAGSDTTLLIGTQTTYAGSWISDNDDFSKVTGDMFTVNSSVSGANGATVKILGGTWPSFDFQTGGSFWKDLMVLSTRKAQIAVTPTGGGIVGDTYQLDDTAYAAAASTDPVEWRCVQTNKSAATWVATLQKP